MNVTANISIKPFHEIMAQYAERCEEAAAADKAYCWCHDVWAYGAQIEEDYKEINMLVAKANLIQGKMATAGKEYVMYLKELQDKVLYALHHTACNPGPVNCGIQWFN